MRVPPRTTLALLAATAICAPLSGCVGTIVSTAVTAPFKVAGKAVDLATTSQDEADRNAGRKLRKQQERQH